VLNYLGGLCCGYCRVGGDELFEAVLGVFENLFGSQYMGWSAAIFAISLLPGVGGPMTTIPLGAALGLPVPTCAVICVIGNIFPVPFIILFIRTIFRWMRKKSQRLGRIADKFEDIAKSRGNRLRRGVFVGLLIFVAIPLPLPGMGAWTGALIASVFNIRIKTALPAISIGVFIAALFAVGVTYRFISLIL